MSDADFPIEDRVGAWVPHGRFVLAGASRGALAGLDFAVKDVFDVGGHPTGAGNPEWLATHAVPQTSNPVVERLLAAGATMMGKVLTDELAFSLHGDNAHYGAPINAAAPDRVTGGSSSGSAAAVAARLVDFALGTDTGGSTRIPASYCGLWGLRTTHGLLSTHGMVPLHPSYDTVTWLAAEAEVFERVGATLLPVTEYAPHHVLVLDDARGLADTVFARPLARVVQALEKGLATIASFRSIADGAELESWRQTYATSGAWEAWQVHGQWISTHEPDFGAAVGARFRAASGVTDAAAEAARTEAARIRAQVREAIGSDRIAVLPSAASLAPRRDADAESIDAVRMRTMAITCIAGLAGLPQVSIPMASDEGVPLGISLLGPAGSDLALIRIACELAGELGPAPVRS